MSIRNEVGLQDGEQFTAHIGIGGRTPKTVAHGAATGVASASMKASTSTVEGLRRAAACAR